MRTDRVVAVAVVVLGVLAIGATAASYDAVEPVSVSGAEDGDPGNGSGSGLPAGGETGATETVPLPGWLVENFVRLTFGLGTLLFVVGSAVITWMRGLDGLRQVFARLSEAVASGALYLVVVAFLVWLVFGFTGEGIDALSSPPAESAEDPSGGSAGDQAAESEGRSIPYWYVLIGVWVLLGVGWFYLFGRGDGDETAATGGTDGQETGEVSDSDAGLPAEETIADVPPSNPVYSAWREMAAAVGRETDRTLTANEVAAVASENGFDDDAVRTLTGLFEEVRYGDRPVTEDRERRAKSAIESIERSGGGAS